MPTIYMYIYTRILNLGVHIIISLFFSLLLCLSVFLFFSFLRRRLFGCISVLHNIRNL